MDTARATIWPQYPFVLRENHVRDLTGLGRNKVLGLFHQPGFPAIRFGRCIGVTQPAFATWLEAQQEK